MAVKKRVQFFEDSSKLKNTVTSALKYYELPGEINLKVLENWIGETATPLVFIGRVFEQARLESELEAEKLLDILTRLWNITPRPELGGMSPFEKQNSPKL
ncbi:MAG: hypothetical protein A2445_00995 [Candidatus Jacksonbacteria bacterium RIFOXYC2_FULL_44_29]|nr:MAG: hypothetical protein UW45_C0019G0031 [Parcubacteria group bacterium GW2011_GWC2_44_22]OGY74666.1 MAG: hypothetical protein A2240_06130 [Candidatus Jacksonbacteria bacterium RIFOXYA2_FULL_43_12]OGY75369.1 MAG: hypothetical protein A2295_04295 [Candidatus Jacksonbacteria bacterium RIFOXYB2_FULL_44_15]OGY77362.1 MAG: hypothetical protein A2445_00995 [Candidatus Jacksonbacteria bacterium RIFOXYC2_FULL_44_29]OGY82020.1 MAG: hypothetical protein A2550_00410 [Candidatus Jacksonbacteria bacteri